MIYNQSKIEFNIMGISSTVLSNKININIERSLFEVFACNHILVLKNTTGRKIYCLKVMNKNNEVVFCKPVLLFNEKVVLKDSSACFISYMENNNGKISTVFIFKSNVFIC